MHEIGRKDCNGSEIMVGDILEYAPDKKSTLEVHWNKYRLRYDLYATMKDRHGNKVKDGVSVVCGNEAWDPDWHAAWDQNSTERLSARFEVVGNVGRNPKLIGE